MEPGKYIFELYGASGGSPLSIPEKGRASTIKISYKTCKFSDDEVKKWRGNSKCRLEAGSNAGAGGYVRASLTIKKKTPGFLTLGGMGAYYEENIDISSSDPASFDEEKRPKGGFNGGGRGGRYQTNSVDRGVGGGGGGSDLRLLVDDPFHRVLVGGGGGGSDNYCPASPPGDDGSGGAGGDETAQGFFINGFLESSYVAGQSSGFSFFQGEASQLKGSKNPKGKPNGEAFYDRPGAGGGWFGGFSSHHGNGGAGGGSSYALTSSSDVLEGKTITIFDDQYNINQTGTYAFNHRSQYLFEDVIHVPGIWEGSGMARVTYFLPSPSKSFSIRKPKPTYFFGTLFLWSQITSTF